MTENGKDKYITFILSMLPFGYFGLDVLYAGDAFHGVFLLSVAILSFWFTSRGLQSQNISLFTLGSTMSMLLVAWAMVRFTTLYLSTLFPSIRPFGYPSCVEWKPIPPVYRFLFPFTIVLILVFSVMYTPIRRT